MTTVEQRRHRRRFRAGGLLGAVMLLAGGCTLEQAYQRDQRVDIVSPRPHERVALPVTIRWHAKDFDVAEPAWRSGQSEAGIAEAADDSGYFAVFVNRPPIPPGEEVMTLVDDTGWCRTTPACPDEQYFADRGVYLTAQTELTLPTLPDRRPHDSANDWHEATIVFVRDNPAGTGEIGEARRMNASAFSVRFAVER